MSRKTKKIIGYTLGGLALSLPLILSWIIFREELNIVGMMLFTGIIQVMYLIGLSLTNWDLEIVNRELKAEINYYVAELMACDALEITIQEQKEEILKLEMVANNLMPTIKSQQAEIDRLKEMLSKCDPFRITLSGASLGCKFCGKLYEHKEDCEYRNTVQE